MQPPGQVLRFLGVVYGADEQPEEPAQRVLVHGVDTAEVRDAEEKDGRVLGDGRVAHARLTDLLLGFLGDLLFLGDLVAEEF